MPEKRTSFFACLVAGLCLALVWLGGIVFIFSYFRDPVFGDWRGGEPSGLVLAANGLAYLASCFVFAAGAAAIASRRCTRLADGGPARSNDWSPGRPDGCVGHATTRLL